MQERWEKAVRIADRITDSLVLVLCIVIALLCLYAGYDNALVYAHAGDETLLAYKPEKDLEKTRGALSSDCVGWITIDDTGIDYPVMQGEDNSEYLNRDPYGNYALSGSIFLDADNAPDFSDPYSLLYGHHMDYGAMFGALDDFRDSAFFKTHRTGTLITENGPLAVTIFAVLETDVSCREVFDVKGDHDLAGYLQKNAAIYEAPEEGRRILGMSTCRDAGSPGRLVVFGTLGPAPQAQ